MTTKIAISLPDEIVEHARREVREGRAKSVSAFVCAAMTERMRHEKLELLLEEMLEEAGGPPTDEERAWAREQLG